MFMMSIVRFHCGREALERKSRSHVKPDPAFVMAGATRRVWPAKGWMDLLYAVRARGTVMQAEPSTQRSGSLKLKRASAP